jgi:hypothetical protein
MTARYFPSFLTEIIKNDSYGIECRYSNDRKTAMMYIGKRNKHSFYMEFLSVEKMMSYINGFIANVIRSCVEKAKCKQEQKKAQAALKAESHFKLGDIIYNSWGYEQTNLEYYQVIEIGKKTILVREIAREEVENSRESHQMACDYLPIKDSFLEDEYPFILRLKAYANGSVQIVNSESYYHFSKWDGRPKYCSWYG